MRKTKQQVEAELQDALNEQLPEEKLVEEPALPTEVNKLSLRPRVGDALPIDPVLVGCTKALFYEHRHQTTVSVGAPYCLKANDHTFKGVTYKSMYLIYMGCDSEYEAAIKLLGNYQHWTKLKRCTWFIPYVEDWNAELVLREAALAKSKLVTLTEEGNVTAARTLLNEKKIATAKVGKPKSKGGRKDDVVPGDIEAMLERTDISGKPN